MGVYFLGNCLLTIIEYFLFVCLFVFWLTVLSIFVYEKPPWGVDNKICIVLYCIVSRGNSQPLISLIPSLRLHCDNDFIWLTINNFFVPSFSLAQCPSICPLLQIWQNCNKNILPNLLDITCFYSCKLGKSRADKKPVFYFICC